MIAVPFSRVFCKSFLDSLLNVDVIYTFALRETRKSQHFSLNKSLAKENFLEIDELFNTVRNN